MNITPIRKYSGLVIENVTLRGLPIPEVDPTEGDQRRVIYIRPSGNIPTFLHKFEISIPGRIERNITKKELGEITWFSEQIDGTRHKDWDSLVFDPAMHGSNRVISIDLTIHIRTSDENFSEGAKVSFELYSISNLTNQPTPRVQEIELGGGNFKMVRGDKTPNWEEERFIAIDFGNHETIAAIEILRNNLPERDCVSFIKQKSQFFVRKISSPENSSTSGAENNGGFFGLWTNREHFKPTAIDFGTFESMGSFPITYRTAKRDLASFANAESDLCCRREELTDANGKENLKSRCTKLEYPNEINSKEIKWVYTPKRLPAELFLTNFLEKISGHIFSGYPDNPEAPGESQFGLERVGALTGLALTYPTTYGKKEIIQLKRALHRAWMRRLGIDQTSPAEYQDRENFVKIRDFVKKFPATVYRTENHVEHFPLLETKQGLVPGLMIDEATAAGYFFIKEGILEGHHGIKSGRDVMRFKYPEGIRFLMVDCGAGTTDVSLIQANLVESKGSSGTDREILDIKVLDRSGDRAFCGDFITAKIAKLLKAKVFLYHLLSNKRESEVLVQFEDQKLVDSFKQLANKYRQSKNLFSESLAREFPNQFELLVNELNRIFGSSFLPNSLSVDLPRLNTRRNIADKRRGISDIYPDRVNNLINLIEKAETIKLQITKEYERTQRTKQGSCSVVVYLSQWFDLEDPEDLINIHKDEIDALILEDLDNVIKNINDGFLKHVPDRKDFFPDGEKWRRVDYVVLSGRASLYPTILQRCKDHMAVLYPEDMVGYLHQLVPGYSKDSDSIELMKRCVVRGALYALRDVNSQVFPVRISRKLEDVLPFDVWYDNNIVFQSGSNYSDLVNPPRIFKLHNQSDTNVKIGSRITLYRTFKGQSAGSGKSPKCILSIHEFPQPIAGEISISWNQKTFQFEVLDINNKGNRPIVEEKDPVGNESPLWDGSI